ncbi:hypothetical protein BDV96DRAFT_174846 [Lophiotrema nucula]|uniref:BTB domain-containing protein n=1 Tax=Lophiotrema nucula TaxID=690887 RepID=A0A6A5YXN4_9PLEO|nr:hypothetical protein BDV96DRAFT_174846 [Lophiotrema nucula]
MSDTTIADTTFGSTALLAGPTIELTAGYSDSQSWYVHQALLHQHLPLLSCSEPKIKVEVECSNETLSTLVGWLYYGKIEIPESSLEQQCLDASRTWKLGDRYGAHEFRDLAMQRLWNLCVSRTALEKCSRTIVPGLVSYICRPNDTQSESTDTQGGHLYRFILNATAYLWDCPDSSGVYNEHAVKGEWEAIAKEHPKFHNDLVFMLTMPRGTRKGLLGQLDDYVDMDSPEMKPLARKSPDTDHIDLTQDAELKSPKRMKRSKSVKKEEDVVEKIELRDQKP